MTTGRVVSYGWRFAVAATLVGAQASSAQDLNPYGLLTRSVPTVVGGANDSYPSAFNVISGIDYFASRVNFLSPFSIVEFTAQLFSGNTLIKPDLDGIPIPSQFPNSFVIGVLGVGSSRLEIAGNTMGRSGPDNYSKPLRLTAPIKPMSDMPEPKMWAMMLVGISLVGIRLSRKSRLAAARCFT